MPLTFSAVAFAVLATIEWRRLPFAARVYLGVATAFALGALTHPGMGMTDLIGRTHDGVAYVVAAARVAGLTTVLISVTAFLRRAAPR